MRRSLKISALLGFAVVLIALLFSLSYGVTKAYLTASDSVMNTFSIGETEGEIEEEFPDPQPEPGVTLKKQAKIRNTGNLPAFVRVKLVYSDGIAEALTGITGIDSSVWKYDPVTDYYYYTNLVAPGEATADFMTGVTFLTTNGDYVYENLSEFDLTIYAEMYQHIDHIGSCTESEYREIWNRWSN